MKDYDKISKKVFENNGVLLLLFNREEYNFNEYLIENLSRGIISNVSDFIVYYKVFTDVEKAKKYYREFLSSRYEFICFYDTKNTLLKQL